MSSESVATTVLAGSLPYAESSQAALRRPLVHLVIVLTMLARVAGVIVALREWTSRRLAEHEPDSRHQHECTQLSSGIPGIGLHWVRLKHRRQPIDLRFHLRLRVWDLPSLHKVGRYQLLRCRCAHEIAIVTGLQREIGVPRAIRVGYQIQGGAFNTPFTHHPAEPRPRRQVGRHYAPKVYDDGRGATVQHEDAMSRVGSRAIKRKHESERPHASFVPTAPSPKQ